MARPMPETQSGADNDGTKAGLGCSACPAAPLGELTAHAPKSRDHMLCESAISR